MNFYPHFTHLRQFGEIWYTKIFTQCSLAIVSFVKIGSMTPILRLRAWNKFSTSSIGIHLFKRR